MTSYCRGCEQITESIRKSRATLICKVCGYDKTFGDLLQKLEGQKDMPRMGREYWDALVEYLNELKKKG